jgi:hypothetical protein
MATIIDALVVKLGLDSSDLSKSTPAATKQLKGLEEQGAKTEGSVKKVGTTSKESASGIGELSAGVKTLLVALGAASVAVGAFVESMVGSAAAVDRLSKNINVNAGEITAWGNAAEELGGKASGLQASLSLLSKAQTQISVTGESSLVPYLNFLGVSMADAGGHARKVTDVLADLASAAEGKDRPTMHNIFAEMGITEDTINLLLLGRKELDISLKHQAEYAEKMKQFSGEGSKLQKSLVDIKQQFTLLGLTLLQQAAPAFEKILSWVQELNPTFERFIGYLSDLGGWAQRNADFLKLLAGAFAIVVFPVAALGAAIIGLFDDYQVWKKGGDSLINWAQWSKEIDLAVKGMEFLKRVAITAFEAIGTAASVAIHVANGDLGGANRAFIAGTQRMNKVMGNNAGPDEAHDQGATATTKLVKKIPGALKDAWGPGDTAGAGKPGGKVSQQDLMAYYMAHGKSKQEASALASNAWSESSGNPNAIGDNGAAFGLLQWHGDRQANFKKKYGFDIHKATWQQQADFQMFELSNEGKEHRAGEHMARAGSAYDAAAIESRESQRPGLTQAAKDKAAAQRGQLAQLLNGNPGAANAVAMLNQHGASSSTTHHDNRVSNHIDSVIINAPSGDAAGIAQAFRSLNIFPAQVAVVGVS